MGIQFDIQVPQVLNSQNELQHKDVISSPDRILRKPMRLLPLHNPNLKVPRGMGLLPLSVRLPSPHRPRLAPLRPVPVQTRPHHLLQGIHDPIGQYEIQPLQRAEKNIEKNEKVYC